MGSIMSSQRKGGLNFRDLQHFNKALLAKQVWRMISKPNLLVSRVIKNRYAHQISLLHAPIKSNSSIIWKGFVWARELLLVGLRKRVGNGLAIDFFKDPWIPKETTFKPLCRPSLIMSTNMLIAEFITPSLCWDINKLKRYVIDKDADIISSIPINNCSEEDKWIWHYTSHGEYTVKSGYKLSMTDSVGQGSSSLNSLRKWWVALWETKIPSKIKVFIWKAFHNCLPTNFCLWRKGVDILSNCKFCTKFETVDHALCGCK